MNKFATIIFFLSAVVAAICAGCAAPFFFTEHCCCLEGLFNFSIILLFPLFFGTLAYCSQRTSFVSNRFFWMIGLIISVAAWIIIFGATRVHADAVWVVCGEDSSPAPWTKSFYLWQRPWLIHRLYIEMFGAMNMGLFIIIVYWSLSLPVMSVLSAWHIWLLSRRHHSS